MDNLKARFGRAVKTWPALLLAAGMAMVLTISPARAADPALKILLKKGITSVGEMKHVNMREISRVIKAGATSPQVLLGIFFEALFFTCLLVLMSETEISFQIGRAHV